MKAKDVGSRKQGCHLGNGLRFSFEDMYPCLIFWVTRLRWPGPRKSSDQGTLDRFSWQSGLGAMLT